MFVLHIRYSNRYGSLGVATADHVIYGGAHGVLFCCSSVLGGERGGQALFFA